VDAHDAAIGRARSTSSLRTREIERETLLVAIELWKDSLSPDHGFWNRRDAKRNEYKNGIK